MKRLLSIILGVMLMIIPLAGCEKEKDKTEIYFSGNQWVFADDGEEETVLSLTSTVAVTVNVINSFPEPEVPSLYLNQSDLDKIQTLFDGILHKKITMQETDEFKGGDVTFKIYTNVGDVKTVWATQDGRVVYRADGGYYVSEEGTTKYPTIVECCNEWQWEYPYTLKQTGTELVFAEDEQQPFMIINLQDVSFGSFGKAIDSVRAKINTSLREEMILSALRLEQGQVFRETTTQFFATEVFEIEITYNGENYSIFVSPEGSIMLCTSGNTYYITNHNVVSYNLFLELFYEWRLR